MLVERFKTRLDAIQELQSNGTLDSTAAAVQSIFPWAAPVQTPAADAAAADAAWYCSSRRE